ncbi:MAG: hypothetical protein HY706_21930 [Candidatus Hydrogenedentes bacterium]|nr:hypothetical protein [Candidatus Hydrogenedentota bacterium]
MFGTAKLTDDQLVRQVLTGHGDQYRVLVERYLSLAHALAYAHTGNHADAEDIAQEAFMKAFLSLNSLREAGVEQMDIATLIEWVCIPGA